MDTSARRLENLRQAMDPSFIHQEVIIAVRFAKTSGVSVKTVNGEVVNCIEELAVQGRELTELPVLAVVGNEPTRLIDGACVTSQEVELFAEVVIENDRYALRFISCQPIQNAMQLVGASEIESLNAAGMASRLGDRALEHILSMIYKILKTVSPKPGSLMEKAFIATILQAVSSGRLNGTPARTYNLLIGPPSVGKGQIARAAVLLGPVSVPIGANSVTPAGLIGYSDRQKHGRRLYFPGALACASGGVAILEEAQNVDTHAYRHVFGILSEAMERGRVARTTAGLLDIAVDAALLVDLNPKSTVRPASMNKDVVVLEDIGLPLNFITRMDCVFYFNREIEQQIETTLGIIDGTETVGPEAPMAANPEVRELRTLIAYLRDQCPTIQLGGVTELITARVKDVFERNEDKLKELHLASDFLMRTGKSILKLVAAATRLRGTCTANEADVNLAFELVQTKLDFISRIEPAFDSVSEWKRSPDGKEKRGARIVEHFGGKAVNIKDVCSMFPDLDRRTIMRDLHDLGARPNGTGIWSIPTRRSA
jgi:hypothetical protein